MVACNSVCVYTCICLSVNWEANRVILSAYTKLCCFHCHLCICLHLMHLSIADMCSCHWPIIMVYFLPTHAVMEWVELEPSSVFILSWRDSRQSVWWTSFRLSSMLASTEQDLSKMLYVIYFSLSFFVSLLIVCVSSSQEQYAYCHEVLADFVHSYDNYANFKELV